MKYAGSNVTILDQSEAQIDKVAAVGPAIH